MKIENGGEVRSTYIQSILERHIQGEESLHCTWYCAWYQAHTHSLLRAPSGIETKQEGKGGQTTKDQGIFLIDGDKVRTESRFGGQRKDRTRDLEL